MKKLSLSKKLILCVLSLFLLASVSLAFVFRANTNANVATGEELRVLFLEYLADNGITEEEDIVKAQTNKIKNSANKTYTRAFIEKYTAEGDDRFGILYNVNGRSTDDITEEGAAIIQECFGVDAETFLLEGGTTDYVADSSAYTKKFIAQGDNIKAGGESVNEGDFSIIVMGDQQTAVEYNSEFVAKSYNWVRDNAEAMNLKAFISVGDIVDDCDFMSWRVPSGNPYKFVNYNGNRMLNWKMQLQFSKNQADKLLDLGIPVAMTMGNHDYEDMAESYRVKDSFNDYFTYSDFSSKSWFGESLYNDLEAATYNFSANGTDYMIMTLGTYPTDEILAWANQKVAANPDKKVIVSMHSYMMGTSKDLTDCGFKSWNTFLRKHENIFMVVCGHECTTDGSVIRRVDFGDNGNPVYQFMINPQIEEFGGSGIVSQFIFRADGSVDFVYYSPFAAENNGGKGYFMQENQFTFNLDTAPVTASGSETVFGNEVNAVSGEFSYLGNATSKSWQDSVYAICNAEATNRGLTTSSSGYVIHKLNASDYSRFTSGKINVAGRFLSEDGAYQVETSFDGINWVIASYNDYEMGQFGNTFVITDETVGAEELYIKISFTDAVLVKTTFSGTEVLTTVVEESKQFNYTYPNSLGTSNYSIWNMTNAYGKYQAILSGGRLGTGDAGKLSYKSYVEYRYDSGFSGRYINGLTVDASMYVVDPTRDAEGHELYEEDTKYFLRYSLSLDGGKTYQVVKTHLFTDLTYTSYVATPNLSDDFNEYLADKNATSVIVRAEYFGAGATFCNTGINSLSINVSFDKEYVNPEIEYDLNGGYINDYISEPQKDGYVFEGWHLGTVDGVKVEPEGYADSGVKLVAKWLKVNKITYCLNGGTNSADNAEFVIEGASLTLANPSKNGKTFLCWVNADKQKVETIIGGTQDIVLYAYWI